MPRVYSVKSSRKEHKCGKCSKVIPKKSAYYWAKPRYGPKYVRCTTCGPPKYSEMTSGKKAPLYAFMEEISGVIAKFDEDKIDLDLAEAATEMVSCVADDGDNIAEEYEESAMNMEEYFSGSCKVDELNETADMVRDAAEEWRTIYNDLDYLRDAIPDCNDKESKLEMWKEFIDKLAEAEDVCFE